MKKIFTACLLITTMLSGCTTSTEPVRHYTATEYYAYSDQLPKNAEIVEDLGNGWIIYKILVLGEIRWFKARYESDLVGKAQYALQTVTELRPPASYYGYTK